MKNQIIEYLELTIEQVEKDIELQKTEYRTGKLYAYKESLAVVKKINIPVVVKSFYCYDKTVANAEEDYDFKQCDKQCEKCKQ